MGAARRDLNHMSQYWLLKSEPSVFSIQDLARASRKTTCWEGVRNYQARNLLQSMKIGDQAFFYHSNADPPAIVGIVKVVRAAYPDSYALDLRSKYFDSKSTKENPRWFAVDVQWVDTLHSPIGLNQLRGVKGLEQMELLRKGSRLSVQPVRESEWNIILGLLKKTVQQG